MMGIISSGLSADLAVVLLIVLFSLQMWKLHAHYNAHTQVVKWQFLHTHCEYAYAYLQEVMLYWSMGTMTLAAAYLQEKREQSGLTRPQVAARIQSLMPDLSTSESTIWRIERGQQEPSAPLLAAFVHVVDGDIAHIKQLLLSAQATIEDARALARGELTAGERTEAQGLIARYGSEEVRDVVNDMLHEIDQDLNFRGALRAFWEGWQARKKAVPPRIRGRRRAGSRREPPE